MMKRRSALGLFASALASPIVLSMAHRARAEGGPPGITAPVVFDPFNPGVGRCSPENVLKRTLAFARDNRRGFMEGVDHGLSLAAKDRGLAYETSVADDDPALMILQVQAFLDAKVGALVAAPVDSVGLAPYLQALIWSGAYVGTVVPPPATTILNAPQYLTGKVLGDAAAAYIAEQLGGQANVVLLTHDSLEFLAPRFTAMRDSLRALPGATIVADISPVIVSNKGGYDTMKTVLLAEPKVDVVLGADTVVLGALAAMREAGKARPDQFFGGIDGEADAISELKASAGPFKTSVSLASPVFGYAMGQHAADWMEGKSIPQAIDVQPFALNADNLRAYQADMDRPDTVFADPLRRAVYLKMYGNICTDTRDQYVNFPWSSEVRE
jgi:ribose transport system substrate-binding protein